MPQHDHHRVGCKEQDWISSSTYALLPDFALRYVNLRLGSPDVKQQHVSLGFVARKLLAPSIQFVQYLFPLMSTVYCKIVHSSKKMWNKIKTIYYVSIKN